MVFITPFQGLRTGNRLNFLTQAVGLGFAMPPRWGYEIHSQPRRRKGGNHRMKATATQLDNRDQLLVRLAESRSMTDDLFRIVRTNALYDRPIPERHRIVFYIGHLEAFDWNLIADQALGLGPAHKEFDRLFAFGIDPVGGGLPTDQPSDWPGLSEINAYDLRVRQELDRILSDRSQASASRWQYPREIILNVAIEHRLMHAETLAYMLHQLPTERKIAPRSYRPRRPRSPAR